MCHSPAVVRFRTQPKQLRELVVAERLAHALLRACPAGSKPDSGLQVVGHEHDHGVRPHLVDGAHHLDPAPAGQGIADQHEIDVPLRDQGQGAVARAGPDHAMTAAAEAAWPAASWSG